MDWTTKDLTSPPPDFTDRQHESPARDVRGFVWRRKPTGEMVALRKRVPRFLIRFYELEPAQHGNVTRRTVT